MYICISLKNLALGVSIGICMRVMVVFCVYMCLYMVLYMYVCYGEGREEVSGAVQC